MLLAIFQRTPECVSGHVQPKLSIMKPRRPIIVQAFREASNIFQGEQTILHTIYSHQLSHNIGVRDYIEEKHT